jgi:hypothetical protein
VTFLAVAAVLLGCMVLTASGERSRGRGIAVAVAAGIFFPVSWAVWYVRDERPYRTGHRA